MDTRFRCFWVGEDGRLHPIGRPRFARIFYEGTEAVPELAGRMVPLIEIVYETNKGKATQLIRARGYRFPFDASGRLDLERQRRFYPWGALLDERDEAFAREGAKVRSIGSRIAARRIRQEIFFDPTPDQIHAVLLALGLTRPLVSQRRRLRVIGGKGK